MALGTLALRLTVGGLLTAHGLQKLRGTFDGPGIEGTTGMMQSLGLHPARRNALAAAWSETAGGAALALGAATPAAAAAVIGAMTTAIRTVHAKNGVWNAKGGYEFNAVLIAAAVAIAADGPGRASLDALVGRSRWGAGAGLLALLAGVGGSFAITELAKREAEEHQAAGGAEA
ncbi:DoxX family protein [Amnibacterium endophyticum]|uniref:DoxX family protein n=1 Tax=Amnibacterium endophyticum TaxID=2109337 RepID=A0ABW4LIA7_9MICO